MNDQKALSILRDSYKLDFANYVLDSNEFGALVHKLSQDFVRDRMAVVDESAQTEMAKLLRQSLSI